MDEIAIFGEVREGRESSRKRAVPKQCRDCANLCEQFYNRRVCRFHLIRRERAEWRETYPYGKCPQHTPNQKVQIGGTLRDS